jgi:hypothetical protein
VTTEIAMRISGLLFWLIIVTNVGSNMFGYQTFGDLDVEAKLQKINLDPKRFKIGFALIFIEHIIIILLAMMLFVAFNEHNIMLAIVWVVFRGGEGLMQIVNKKNYWRLLDVARQYSAASEVESNTSADLRLSILNSKRSNFVFAQLLFSIGTLTYSILFVTYGVVPAIIGWSGIVASILYGAGNAITIAKPNTSQALWNLAGLLILLFEIVLGGWLLFH